MIDGEIDLSIGADLSDRPFIFNEFTTAGIPLLIAMILRARRSARSSA